jgi:hypothetical protein
MINTDYWLGLMRRLADEVRAMSGESNMRANERKLHCEKCHYVRVTSDSVRHYCPNGCGELRADQEVK